MLQMQIIIGCHLDSLTSKLKYLILENKLLNVITPNIKRCPKLFKKSLVKDYLFYLHNIKNEISYKDVPIKK